jgi:MoaA/NifB/PqqE/SkfB family radical SAM enzyme
MSYALAVRNLDALEKMGCRIVIFEGGEPLLWSDGASSFSDIARRARRSFMCVGAATNGTLPLDVPVDALWVSVDGLKDIHNDLRSGSYDKIMANIRSSSHPKIFVHYTLNARNFRELPAAAEVLSSFKQVRGITLQLFYPYQQGEDDLRLSPPERAEAMRTAIRLKRLGYPVMNSYWSLRAMIRNTWRCRDRLLVNVEPDGTIFTGCYVKNRGIIQCRECGFTPIAEASGAFRLRPGSLKAGCQLFLR